MSIVIENDYRNVSLQELQKFQEQGYSVVKTPHVGNQHPSNLVCAALGFDMQMVSFNRGTLDKNFHPHLRIENGVATQLSEPEVWTPFASTACGSSLTKYHQDAVQKRFMQTDICTDTELFLQHEELAKKVLVTATEVLPRLWYRRVSKDGVVVKKSDALVPCADIIMQDVFGFSNAQSGWVIPNRIQILFAFAFQTLSTGKDLVYHLSGPQMVGYIGKQQKSLSKAYDALRLELPELPELLTVRVVPVAQSRLVTHVSRTQSLQEVEEVFAWYEDVPPQERRHALERFKEVAVAYPEFTDSIEEGRFMSQYDIASVDDLAISQWMLATPVKRVLALQANLQKALRIPLAA